MPNYVIKGEKVGFAPLNRENLDKFRKWLNDLEVNKYTTLFGTVLTAEKEEEWYENQSKQDDLCFFTIYSLKEDVPIGNCSLTGLEHKDRRGELGIVLGEKEYWNRGMGTESVRLLTDYGFTVLNLHSIRLQLKGFNKRALRAYEKAGYKIAGEWRDYWYINGSYYNSILMDILDEEFYRENDSLIEEQYMGDIEKTYKRGRPRKEEKGN